VLPSAVHQTRRVDICWNKLLLQIRQSQCNVSSTRSKSVAMNADWSTLPFLICKFIQEVLGIDINLSAQLKISVQVFCPTSLQNPYEIRYIPWMMIKPQKVCKQNPQTKPSNLLGCALSVLWSVGWLSYPQNSIQVYKITRKYYLHTIASSDPLCWGRPIRETLYTLERK